MCSSVRISFLQPHNVLAFGQASAAVSALIRHAACGFLTLAIPSYTAAKCRACSDLYAGCSNEHRCNVRRAPELDFLCVSKDRLTSSHSSHLYRATICKIEGFVLLQSHATGIARGLDVLTGATCTSMRGASTRGDQGEEVRLRKIVRLFS